MARRRTAGPSAKALLGPLEYEAMRALWKSAPANVSEVLERINASRRGEPLAYTTVMTVLARLHEKGLLERVKAGRGYDYTPKFDEPGLVEHLGRREVAGLVSRYGEVAIAHFAETLQGADPELLRRLVKLAGEGTDE
jgi:predicted transcriptional regulator